MPIFNRARVSGNDDSGQDQKIKRFVHSPLQVEHNGINAAITENGKVVLSKPAGKDKETNETLYDEIEIPASLVFKLAQLLKATRKIRYVNVQDAVASEQ